MNQLKTWPKWRTSIRIEIAAINDSILARPAKLVPNFFYARLTAFIIGAADVR